MEKCTYCEGSGKDIFNKTEDCPFCLEKKETAELLEEKIRQEITENLEDDARELDGIMVEEVE